MDQQQTTPTLAQVMGTLDELAAAARAADADRYRAAVRLAQRQQINRGAAARRLPLGPPRRGQNLRLARGADRPRKHAEQPRQH